MDNFTVYSQAIKEFQNSLLEPMKQVQAMQNSFLEIMQPMQSRLSEIQALCNSAYAPLQSLQSAFTANLQFQSQLSSIASIGSQLQNGCINPYIKELKSCGSMLSSGAVNPNFGNAESAFSSASLAFSSNVLTDACRLSASISEPLDAGRILSEAFTLPPVYSISSAVHEIKNIMVDVNSCEPTDAFKDLVKNLVNLPYEELQYVPVSFDEVEFSPGLSNIIEETLPDSVIDTPRQKGKFRFPMPKAELIISLLSLCIAIASYCDSRETSKQITAYQQEEISIQREMLELQRREIELLEKQSSNPSLSDNSEVNVESSNQNCDN